jgi:hypothetical protein
MCVAIITGLLCIITICTTHFFFCMHQRDSSSVLESETPPSVHRFSILTARSKLPITHYLQYIALLGYIVVGTTTCNLVLVEVIGKSVLWPLTRRGNYELLGNMAGLMAVISLYLTHNTPPGVVDKQWVRASPVTLTRTGNVHRYPRVSLPSSPNFEDLSRIAQLA